MIQHLTGRHATSASDLHAMISELNSELSLVVGFSTSVRKIGLDLPSTPRESDDTLCPELVFPSLASSILRHTNSSILLLEQLSGLLHELLLNSEAGNGTAGSDEEGGTA